MNTELNFHTESCQTNNIKLITMVRETPSFNLYEDTIQVSAIV